MSIEWKAGWVAVAVCALWRMDKPLVSAGNRTDSTVESVACSVNWLNSPGTRLLILYFSFCFVWLLCFFGGNEGNRQTIIAIKSRLPEGEEAWARVRQSLRCRSRIPDVPFLTHTGTYAFPCRSTVPVPLPFRPIVLLLPRAVFAEPHFLPW